MPWEYSLDTHVWIFSVGRGNAAFIRTGMNQGFILDMNASEFDVAKFIKDNFVSKLDSYSEHKIAQAVLSHPHGDHIAKCGEVRKGCPLEPALLTCPHHKDPVDGSPSEKLNWDRIINRESDAENVEIYKSLYAQRNLPLQTIQYVPGRNVPNLEYGIFYIRPPVCEKIHCVSRKSHPRRMPLKSAT
jgi:ribonuclease BN (tRNA processing enzyme)